MTTRCAIWPEACRTLATRAIPVTAPARSVSPPIPAGATARSCIWSTPRPRVEGLKQKKPAPIFRHACSTLSASRRVGAGAAKIDCGDRLSPRPAARSDEAEARNRPSARSPRPARRRPVQMPERRSTRSRGTFSPKNTTSGLSTPPQRRQAGTRRRKSRPLRDRRRHRAHPPRQDEPVRVQALSSSCSSSRGDRAAAHAADEIEPSRAGRSPALLPAAWCSRSTFWVSRSSLLPIASSRARARWASLGRPGESAASRSGCAPNSAGASFLAHEGLIGHRLAPASSCRRRRGNRGCLTACCSPRPSG